MCGPRTGLKSQDPSRLDKSLKRNNGPWHFIGTAVHDHDIARVWRASTLRLRLEALPFQTVAPTHSMAQRKGLRCAKSVRWVPWLGQGNLLE